MQTELTPSSPDSRTRRHLFLILAIAFLIRIFVLFHFHTYDLGITGSPWGFEIGNVSRSLAEGRGFGSPFGGDTGPTVWVAPLYPALQTVVFKILGIQSTASAIAMRLLNIVFDLAVCWLLFKMTARLWGRNFGLISAWLWALFPNAIWFSTSFVGYTGISVLLLLLGTAQALDFDISRRSEWIKLGLLWGVIALTNPSLLSLLPLCCVYIALNNGKLLQHWREFAISFAIVFVMVLPWTIRNYLVTGALIPVRGNFGHELYKGNHWGAMAQNDFTLNPSDNPDERRKYVDLGERQYILQHKRIAMQFIRDNPAGSFRLLRSRIYFFWSMPDLDSLFGITPSWRRFAYLTLSITGLAGLLITLFRSRDSSSWKTALPRALTPAWLFAAVIVVYPLPYYLTLPTDRYRHPIEPILLIFALQLLLSFAHWIIRRTERSATASPSEIR
jgi:hypothetical protein